MKLYNTKGAPNPRRVLIYLAEKGLTDTIELEEISIMKGEHKQPAYREKSPLGQTPCLVLDDGTSMTESIAICRYLEALHHEPPLFGTKPKQIALIDMWSRRFELSLFIAVAMHFRHTHPAMAELEQQNKEWGLLNKERGIKMMKFVDRSLAGKEFIAGDYSFADIVGLTTLDFATATGIPIPDELENLSAYHQRLLARPSAKV